MKCPTWKIYIHYYDKWGECFDIRVGCMCQGKVTDKRRVNDIGNMVCDKEMTLKEAERILNAAT